MEVKKFKIIHNKYLIFLNIVIILGALNWGSTALGYNLVDLLKIGINEKLKTNYPIDKGIYMFVAVCGILLALNRTTWVPFLDESFFPGALVPLKTPLMNDKLVTINTEPNAKIAYWTALPNTDELSNAYGDFSNSGVVMSNTYGVAKLPILEGSDYKFPLGFKIGKHVHYRIIDETNGVMGKIETKKY
jgi:hypothetical protein